MRTPLTDLSQKSLALAVQANIHDFFRQLRRSPGTEFYEDAEMMRWRTRVPHPWFNGILCKHLPGGDERETIAEWVRYFQIWQVNSFSCWLRPGLPLSAWTPHLQANRFQFDNGTPGMAIDLAQVDFSPTAGPLQIRVVEDNEKLRVWLETFIDGYGIPPGWTEGFLELVMDMGLELPFRYYLGYLEGQPVAASTLFLGAGVAGIYNVATRAAARRKGFGSNLTIFPMREAAAIGYHVGVLQSSEIGFQVYRSLGFEKVCDMDHFIWSKPTAA